MNRSRTRSWLLGVALLILAGSQSAGAVGPSAVLIYGGGLENAVILRYEDSSWFNTVGLLWGGSHMYRSQEHAVKGHALVPSLANRAYLNVAIFWGRAPEKLVPENGTQHGRLYLPTASEPAVAVATAANMVEPVPTPIPTQIDQFFVLWTLSAQDIQTLKRLGVPKL